MIQTNSKTITFDDIDGCNLYTDSLDTDSELFSRKISKEFKELYSFEFLDFGTSDRFL
jgi:hypothetical protein